MSHVSKFLPVAVLAVALAAPFAASARSDHAPRVPDQQQVLVGEIGPVQYQGRAATANPRTPQLIVVSAAQYAAVQSIASPELN